mgnify:CR=1 FL=1
MPTPAEKYDGKPCRNCQTTLKYRSNSTCVACCFRKSVERRTADPARKRELNRLSEQKRREAKRELYRASHARWKSANRDAYARSVNVHTNRRRARKLGVGGKYTWEDKRALYIAQDGICAHCWTPMFWDEATVDHIIPLSRGGDNSPDNLQLLCGIKLNCCNGRKHNRYEHEALIRAEAFRIKHYGFA